MPESARPDLCGGNPGPYRDVKRSKTNRGMKRIVKRLTFAVTFPLLSLSLYWREIDGDYSASQLVLASAIVIVAATGIFLYTPIAKRVERGSLAWGWG